MSNEYGAKLKELINSLEGRRKYVAMTHILSGGMFDLLRISRIHACFIEIAYQLCDEECCIEWSIPELVTVINEIEREARETLNKNGRYANKQDIRPFMNRLEETKMIKQIRAVPGMKNKYQLQPMEVDNG